MQKKSGEGNLKIVAEKDLNTEEAVKKQGIESLEKVPAVAARRN